MLVFKPCKKFLPPKIFPTTTTNSKPHLLHLHLHGHGKLHFPPLKLKAHFKSSTLSSSSSSTLSPPPPSPFDSSSLTTTADFLMDSCGLSYVEALQVIRKKPTLLQDGGRKPRSVIAYFESIGFSKTHISKLISRLPRVLVSDVEKTLKPKIQLFQLDYGFSESDLADLIASKPNLLHRGVKTHMKPGLDLIKSFVKTNEDLIKAIKYNGHFLLRSTRHRNFIEANIHVLRHHGVPDSEIVHLILTQMSSLRSTPKVFKSVVERIVSLGFKPETRKFTTAVSVMSRMKKATWDSKIDLLKGGLGWSDEQILDAFRIQPIFLMLSRENLKEGIEFFKESLNWDTASVLSQHPTVLTFSLKKRVIPRFAVLNCLMSKQIIKPDKQFISMLWWTETEFLSKYVFKYQEQLPYLYEVYKKEDNGDVGVLVAGTYLPGLVASKVDLDLDLTPTNNWSRLEVNGDGFKRYMFRLLSFLVIFPSYGERYIPTVLFQSIHEEVQNMQVAE